MTGEFVAIMGPSGSGKSTLLHLLGGLEPPSEGAIYFDDQVYGQLSDRDLSILRRRKIGVVFQFFNLLPTLNALENVALPLLLDGKSWRDCRQQGAQALNWVGLEGRSGHTPDRLSGGEPHGVPRFPSMVCSLELSTTSFGAWAVRNLGYTLAHRSQRLAARSPYDTRVG